MATDGEKKKRERLGMPSGTASNRLVKMLLYDLARRLGLHLCFRCGSTIEKSSDFSVDHKTPWLNHDDPVKMFFDIENIGFSHRACNFSAGEKKRKNRSPAEIRDIWAAATRRNYTAERRHRKYIEKRQ